MFRFISLLILISISVHVMCDEEKYPDKYDNTNVHEILENDSLRDQFYNCFMDKGPCVTELQQFMKQYLPEVIVTQCRKCTDKQKEAFDVIVAWYTEKRPEEWDALVEKFIVEAQKLGISSR